MELKTRIKLKRDTSSNWTSANPVLLKGELILVDTAEGECRVKIGDGTKTYSQLPFIDEKTLQKLNNKSNKGSLKQFTLRAVDWTSNLDLVLTDSAFFVNGHTYFVNPINTSRKLYLETGVYGDSFDGNSHTLTLKCDEKPTSDITIEIFREEVL